MLWDQTESSWAQEARKLSNADQQKISDNLSWLKNKGANWSWIIPNIFSDRFSSDAFINELIVFFLTIDTSKNLSAIEWQRFNNSYNKICINHTLEGGDISLSPLPVIVGRAVEKSGYISMLSNLSGLNRSLVKKTLFSLERNSLSLVGRRSLNRMKMSKYGTWVTWDRDSNGSDDPFSFSAKKCTNDFRSCLGLPRGPFTSLKRDMIVFRYPSSVCVPLLKPTVADAAAHYRFAVPEHDDHGETKNWIEVSGDDNDAISGTMFIPLPEALHHSIFFSNQVSCETYQNKRIDICKYRI